MIKEIQELQETLNKLKEDFSLVSKEFNSMNNATKILKLSKLYKINTRKNILVQVINLALKDIFFDKEIKVDIETNETTNTALGYNVQYDFIIYKNGNELARNTDIYNSNGGGAISIISWVLKLLMSYLNNTGNFLAFDESFSQVSEKYLNSLSTFIRNICEKYDLHIILITHQNISESAHLTYNLSGTLDNKGVDELVIDRINVQVDGATTIDDVNNCYYLKVSNFQSIVNLDLKIKGFTCILGDSDIGKTALIRSINSIINNDFNANYKRIKSRGSVDIYFGYLNSNNQYHKIHLCYKGGSVYYYLEDGTELKGKALASERILEALSEFGFKQIDISAYKNWNSELKKQTQRLNVTTQHDKLYFSNERNATEKILTLLFNSQGFNIGISNGINNSRDLLNKLDIINSEIDYSTQRLLELNIKLAKAKLQHIDEIIMLYSEKDDYIEKLNYIKQSIINIETETSLVSSKIQSYQNIIDISKQSSNLYHITNELSKNNLIISTLSAEVNSIIISRNSYNYYRSLNTYISKKTALLSDFEKVKIMNNNIHVDGIELTYNTFKRINKLINSINTYDVHIKSKQDIDLQLSKKSSLINKYILLRNKLYVYNKLLKLYSLVNHDKVSILNKNITKLNSDLTKYTLLKSSFITTLKVIQYLSKSKDLLSQLHENESGMNHIYTKYQLHECPHCLGVGLIPITNKEK